MPRVTHTPVGADAEPEAPVVRVDRQGAVAWVWLDRPHARNAMGRAFFSQLPAAFADVGVDPTVRAVVVAARGPHFTVGLDLKEMGQLLTAPAPTVGRSAPAAAGSSAGSADHGAAGQPSAAASPAARAYATRQSILALQRAITAVADCPKPVVAAVHGACIGGGVDLITACDIRLASAEAVFSVRETKVAIVADLGTLQRLPRIVGPGHTAELAFTGKDITASRAAAIGLVNDVVADADALHAAAGALAEEIAANPPLAVQGTKAVLRASVDRTVAEGLEYVATWNAGMLQSADLGEAVTAFLEKRPPRFTGT
jgi:enoyl-CoA hydratase